MRIDELVEKWRTMARSGEYEPTVNSTLNIAAYELEAALLSSQQGGVGFSAFLGDAIGARGEIRLTEATSGGMERLSTVCQPGQEVYVTIRPLTVEERA